MTRPIIACLLAVALGLVACYENPGSAKVEEIKQAIRTQLLLEANKNLLPTIVRLAFHDCVRPKCDGCINLNNHLNNGLDVVIDLLDGIYNGTYNDDVSRADFWQIANLVALSEAVDNNNMNCADDDTSCPINNHTLVFKWGREDCPTSPFTDEKSKFPLAQTNRSVMMDFFKDLYGLSEAQVVALLGAHTLGRAHVDASNYDGQWVEGESLRFNNHYYSLIVDDKDFVPNGIVYKNIPKDMESPKNRKYQFDLLDKKKGNKVGFMLPTDLLLAYDMDVDKLTGTNCCIGVTCPEAPTKGLVEAYAADNNMFMADFSDVMQIVTEFGYTDLEIVY